MNEYNSCEGRRSDGAFCSRICRGKNYCWQHGGAKTISFRLAKPREYTSKAQISKILKEYQKKLKGNRRRTLLICHGRLDERYKFLPQYKHVITLNLDLMSKPDVVGDAWSPSFIKRFPKNYFDQIFTLYCPMGDPVDTRNRNLWKNISYLLKEGGSFRNRSEIIGLYQMRRRWKKANKIKEELTKYFEKYFSEIKFKKVNKKSGKIEDTHEIIMIK